jgi:uncharacterized membrane protein YraQ (UPF0718 family)
MDALAGAIFAGLRTTFAFFWDSFFGLVFGFLISAIVQVVFSRAAMHRFLGPNLRGILSGAGFGIVASACSYGAAAAARGFYQKGADVRAVFAFLISSTNMNLAILILFWTLIGWKFAFAEFFGGVVIIAIVTAGFSLLFRRGELAALAAGALPGGALGPGESPAGAKPARVTECLQCGMEGDAEHAVEYDGTTYLFCGSRHEHEFRADPLRVLGLADVENDVAPRGIAALKEAATWREIVDVALGDVAMLRNELILGYFIAGFAAALVPAEWLAGVLHRVGDVPFAGYPLLLLVGLALAAATFICSMGNVPIARYLVTAGIPLGANTTFIYGDLLIPPLIGIYRKSFPPKITWAFLGLFTLGALLAGALMDALVGGIFGGVALGSMELSDRFTLVANVLSCVALIAVAIAAARGRAPASATA